MTAIARAAHSPRLAVWTCYAAMMCLAVAVNLPPVYLTTFSKEFGRSTRSGSQSGHSARLTEEEEGRIPAAVFAGLVLGIVVTGPLADRLGGKLFAALGVSLLLAGLALLAAASSYAMLLAAGAVMGLGSGILDMVLSPIVSALVSDRRAAAMNWLHSFYCAGALATVFIGSTALGLGIGWRTVALAMLPFPALVLVSFLRMRVPPLVGEDKERAPVATLMSSGFFLATLGAIMLAGASEAGMAMWLPAFVERTMSFAKSDSGFVLAAFLAAMWLGRVVAATLGHRMSPVMLLILSAALVFFLYLAGCFCPYYPLALGACVGVGLAVGALWPTMLALAANRIPHGGATMFAMLAGAGNTGCLLMPWLIGLAANHGSLNRALATAAICPALMIVVLAWMGKRVTSHK